MKQAILLAAYGASNALGKQQLAFFEEKVKTIFADLPIRWAFTSPLMLSRLGNTQADSVSKALVRLGSENFTHVTIQSLHIIPGQEYHSLISSIEEAKQNGAPENISVGLPLLSSNADINSVAHACINCLPKERKSQEPAVWIGHGSKHEADQVYSKLTNAIQKIDCNVFVGTLDGANKLENLIQQSKLPHDGNIWLLPLLSVVGKHAAQDIAGEGQASWSSQLQKKGFTCCNVIKGAIEYDDFTHIWLEHLHAALWK